MVVFDGVELLDIAGPLSVFSKANVWLPGSYALRVLAAHDKAVNSNAGLAILPDAPWAAIDPRSIDTLIIAGGHEDVVLHELQRSDLSEWIKAVASSARRVTSVCTGAFALAHSNVLQERRCTTHWSACGLLQRLCPGTTVVSDQIFVRDGNVWTSAGILTGIDLSLALVEEDLGRDCASQIARLLVLSGMRPGQSPQMSPLLNTQAQASDAMRDLLAWIYQNLANDLSVETMAEHISLSPRHLTRLFQRATGSSPSKYVLTTRLSHAALLLRETDWSIDQIAHRCGLDSVDTLQRGFKKHWGVTPGEYRKSDGLIPDSTNRSVVS
ncbi:GlxA family transcriptional regulator (plasmid) [Acidovorax sp. A79]